MYVHSLVKDNMCFDEYYISSVCEWYYFEVFTSILINNEQKFIKTKYVLLVGYIIW